MKRYEIGLVALLFLFSTQLFSQEYTWSEDIAAIIYDHCSSCHHTGAIAPFELMTYEDAVVYGDAIHHVVDEKSMPPWPADPEYRHFVGEEILSEQEIEAIDWWVSNNFPLGDQSVAPPQPVFPPLGSLLEEIDYTLEMEPYTLQTNSDEYRWFVIENPFEETVYISQIEVFLGLAQVVHHADLFVDVTGVSLANDLLDPLPGFNQNTGFPNISNYINAWQPGANIIRYPENWGFEVPPNSDFVFEIHYGPGGMSLTDTTKMNLRFIKNPQNVRSLKAEWTLNYGSHLIDGPLYIPANEIVTFHQVKEPLTKDISVVTICPHMHQLGKSYRVWFDPPQGGDSIPLIDIPRWDFHWQKYYSFQKIQKIPAGSVIKSEGSYDNTLDNHDNPNNPPIDTWGGPKTEDEMFLCYVTYTDYQPGDEDIVMDSTLLINTGVDDVVATSVEWRVFPIPAKDVLYVHAQFDLSQQSNFELLDISGRSKFLLQGVQSVRDGVTKLDISNLSNGIYVLRWTEGKVIRTEKIFIEK